MSDLLTPKEVAARLRVSTDTLETWRAKRQGPKWIKLGTAKTAPIRYRVSDIEAFMKEEPCDANP